MKKSYMLATLLTGALVSTCLLTSCGNKLNDVITCFDNAQYDEALSIIKNWDMTQVDQVELTAQLQTRLQELPRQYAQETVEYTAAMEYMRAISLLHLRALDEAYASAYAEIQTLYASKENFLAAMDAFQNQEYQKAAALFARVIESDIHYTTATDLLKKATQAYTDALLSQARTMIQTDGYEEALAFLNNALGTLEDDTALRQEISTITQQYADFQLQTAKQEAIKLAASHVKNGDYPEALETLDEFAASYTPDDPDIQDLQTSYTNAYVSFILEKVQALRAEKKYLLALQMLNDAQTVVASETFAQAKTVIEAEKPTYLCEVKCQNSEWYEKTAAGTLLTDTIGNTYSSDNLFQISGRRNAYAGYADHYIGYKYSKLRGTIAMDDRTEINASATLTISGDGVVLYTLTMDRLSVPTTFELDLTNVNVLNFKITDMKTTYGYQDVFFILSDFIFEK